MKTEGIKLYFSIIVSSIKPEELNFVMKVKIEIIKSPQTTSDLLKIT